MKRTCQTAPRLECLEGRDVPAVAIVNPTTATYTDVDGDHVAIKVSKGTLTAGLFTTLATGKGDQLQVIDFSAGGFDGASIAFSVAKVAGGDGLANVGYIDSTGHDLGAVVVKGDLGQIDAGTNSATIPAVKSLVVNSLGRLGTDTQPAGGDVESDITGEFGSLTVKQDVAGAFVNVTGTTGKVGSITIGGSLIGGSGGNSGVIESIGDMGAVKIGHDLRGGSGANSGFIDCSGKIASAIIGGSLLGGSVNNTGEILSGGDLGRVTIGHNVQGGSGINSGFIDSNGEVAGVSIGGALIGGSSDRSGTIITGGDLGAVAIGHDLQGGSGQQSGFIDSNGKLAGVHIAGSLIGGSNTNSGEILSSGDQGAVTIGHDVQGGSGVDSGVIFQFGQAHWRNRRRLARRRLERRQRCDLQRSRPGSGDDRPRRAGRHGPQFRVHRVLSKNRTREHRRVARRRLEFQ